MYKLVSPQSLMAKRAIPEHRRMTSLPLLALRNLHGSTNYR